MMTICEAAPTIGELIKLLSAIRDEHGHLCRWHGWDDGCLIITQAPEDTAEYVELAVIYNE